MTVNSVPAEIRAELTALMLEFFQAVSFESGQMPAYRGIRDLFIDGGKLINNSSELPEIWSVEDFIASRQRMVDAGALTAFNEVETAAATEVFGSVAHRIRETRHAARPGDRGQRPHLDPVHPHPKRMEDELHGLG
jgi:hypothetical protein